MAQPNVIVFFTDQQRWDSTGLHGNPLDLTPNLDRFARRGTHIYNAFTPQPVCGPARACLQTGLYPTTLGCFHNGIPLPVGARTLAHHFGQAGYSTGYIGKWHLANETGPVEKPLQGGYDYWLASNVLEWTSDAYHTTLYDGEGRPVTLPGYRVDAVTDAAIRFIDSRRDRPFFLFLSFIEPHFQNHADNYPAPEGYEERYAGRWMPSDLAALGGSAHKHLAGYWGMVKRLDEAFGRILDSLQSLGMRENTVVAFTSDHGCHFKTRNSEYKRSCHESSIRIPMALGGCCFESGGQVRKLVSLVDLPPTLLDAAGLKAPPEMQGCSILPLLRNPSADWPQEVLVQISEDQIGRAIRTDRWKYCVAVPGTKPFAEPCQQPGSDVYAEYALYDLREDPHELRNLIGMAAFAKVAEELRGRLIRRMVQVGEKPPKIEPAKVINDRRIQPEIELPEWHRGG
ncbi:MAG: sulfatase-like hydrolase/transferase [Planctomycetes bacterium]|nr:sulfatase-like hydrolase/transferase [Planctomycetota bacterium]